MEVIRTNQGETSFREFFDTLKRQRWVLIGTMSVAMGLGFASTKLIEPTYQSSTVTVLHRNDRFGKDECSEPAIGEC